MLWLTLFAQTEIAIAKIDDLIDIVRADRNGRSS